MAEAGRDPGGRFRRNPSGRQEGSVSFRAYWSDDRFCQPVRQLLVIVGRDGYARALCEGMTGDALPRMPIDSRQGTT
jgi:hypothetical protein